MVEQKGNNMIIQFIETKQKPQKINTKKNSHIAFISDNPQKEIYKIEKWIKKQRKSFIKGSWSDKELYFDCPEVFIDFVIEIMHKSIVE